MPFNNKKNTNNKKNHAIIKKALAISIATLALASSCAKNADCDVEGSHAHLYTAQNGLSTYIASEKEYYYGLSRQEEYILTSEGQSIYNDFVNKNLLYSVKDNREVMQQIASTRKPKFEQYTYQMVYDPALNLIVTQFGWNGIEDISNATGPLRVQVDCYNAYTVASDGKGDYIMAQIGPFYDVDDIPDDSYIKAVFYSPIWLEDDALAKYIYEGGSTSDYMRENSISYDRFGKPMQVETDL